MARILSSNCQKHGRADRSLERLVGIGFLTADLNDDPVKEFRRISGILRPVPSDRVWKQVWKRGHPFFFADSEVFAVQLLISS